MKKIKSILIKILGRKQYLSLLSHLYLKSFTLGWLRNNSAYRTHYFVRNLIPSGATVLDIGANLGYYATEFARLVGTGGKVIAVEPIPLYRSILERNTQRLPQVEIWPYALGEQEGTISMGLPFADQYRHGLMKVLSEKEKTLAPEIFEVPVKNPNILFSQLKDIQYIKCDIEGYEVPVLPAMKALIAHHMPIMQVETEGENKKILYQLFNELGYNLYYVGNYGLVPYPSAADPLPGDMIGLPKTRIPEFEHLIAR